MSDDSILIERDGALGWIRINRPERLNAFDNDMLTEWADALHRADQDGDVRAIIITGAGRGFCSGMNVAAEASGDGVLRTQATIATRSLRPLTISAMALPSASHRRGVGSGGT